MLENIWGGDILGRERDHEYRRARGRHPRGIDNERKEAKEGVQKGNADNADRDNERGG